MIKNVGQKLIIRYLYFESEIIDLFIKIKMIDIVGELLKVFLLYFCTIFEKACYNYIFQNIDRINKKKKKTKGNVITHFFSFY